MDDDVRMTGTYQMQLANDGPSIIEARARKLAREAKSRDWRSFLDTAKDQLLSEAIGLPL